MGSRQRIAFAFAAAVIAVLAVVLLSRGSEDVTDVADAPTAQASPSTTATPAATGQAQLQPRSTPTAGTPTPTATPTVQTIRVRGGEPVGGVQRIEATKGDRVTFAVRADAPEEVHVHGYDLERELVAGKATRFSFDATIDGIFEVELHGSGDQIAELRVDP